MMRRLSMLVVALLSVASIAHAQPLLLPEQEHVTLTEDGLMIHWAVVGVPYGPDSLPYVETRHEGRTDFVLADLVGVVAPSASRTSTDGGLHTYVYAAEVITAPAETITYRAGDGVFMTAWREITRPDGADGRLRLAALGDIGVDATGPDGSCTADADVESQSIETECPAHAIRDRIIDEDPGLVVVPGDLAYANSRSGWDAFMRFMTPLQSEVAIMPAMGNHEFEEGLGYHQFLAEYVLPGDEHRFTFQAGPATFVVINSDHLCGPHTGLRGPPQDPCLGNGPSEDYTTWVRDALADAAVDETPWTFVVMHHPPYSYGRHGSNEAIQALYEPWFIEHGVDVVLTSHDHLYSRSHPVAFGEPLADGDHYAKGTAPVYVVTGGGGRTLYEQPDEEPAPWLAAGESVHHYVTFDIGPDRMDVKATRIDGSELDAFSIEATADAAASASTPAPALLAIMLALVAFTVRKRSS